MPSVKASTVRIPAARSVCEFGGASVVSGNNCSQTNTLPHVELLFNELNTMGAFAAASVLTLHGPSGVGGQGRAGDAQGAVEAGPSITFAGGSSSTLPG